MYQSITHSALWQKLVLVIKSFPHLLVDLFQWRIGTWKAEQWSLFVMGCFLVYFAIPHIVKFVLWLRFQGRARGRKYRFARVLRVIDGDTLEVRYGVFSFFSKDKVRMQFIDAPESSQPYGDKTLKHLKFHAKGKMVMIVQAPKPDKYGRTLGEVYCVHLRDSLNLTLVKRGWAWNYQGSKYYQVAEQTARRKRIGLWKDNKPVSPTQWRKQYR